MMPDKEVRAEAPEHTLDRTCLAGLEAGEAYQRLPNSPQLPMLEHRGGGGDAGDCGGQGTLFWGIGGVFAQRGHSANYYVVYSGNTPKTTHLQKDA